MYRVINVKENMPNADYAVFTLDKEISFAKAEGVRALVVIHGYGSMGEGGVIKTEVHKFLTKQKTDKQIINFFAGEKWGEFNQDINQLKATCPALILSQQLRNLNSGITIVWVG